MNTALKSALTILVLFCACHKTLADEPDVSTDILVTYSNEGARALSSGAGAPYRNRKRYAISADARRNADAVEGEYGLVAVDHWPIRSLSVYCFVYRVPAGADRDAVIAQLDADQRIESVQPLQEFQTGTSPPYNDTYASVQHGLDSMGIAAAHRYSEGQGVRVAIVDTGADHRHEDLNGRISVIEDFTPEDSAPAIGHGTAIASVIGARANNGKGIVGVAPRAKLELFVSCWHDGDAGKSICDSFTIAKALDSMRENPPDIVNLSLAGPEDPLVARLIDSLHSAGSIVIAASLAPALPELHFPASHDTVIGVRLSGTDPARVQIDSTPDSDPGGIAAPGDRIMVATPDDAYEFQSGSSLSAAHVSGIAALLLAMDPGLSFEPVHTYLKRSQAGNTNPVASVNACMALQFINPENACIDAVVSSQN